MFQKQPKVRKRKYLDAFQGTDCEAKSLGSCLGDVVGAHLDCSGEKGTGTKTNDCFAGGLCYSHHKQSERGERDFYHRLFVEDTNFMIDCLKAYRLLKFLRWLVSKGDTKDAIEMLRRFK